MTGRKNNLQKRKGYAILLTGAEEMGFFMENTKGINMRNTNTESRIAPFSHLFCDWFCIPLFYRSINDKGF